jgi:hypothetical protein
MVALGCFGNQLYGEDREEEKSYKNERIRKSTKKLK